MSRNNVKLLTSIQLDKLNEKYIFDVEEDNIVVRLRHYNRITLHKLGRPFHINSKIRKVCFSMDAINIWLKLRETTSYTLFDVQQAVNTAYVTYLPIDEKSVLNILKNPDFRIRTL